MATWEQAIKSANREIRITISIGAPGTVRRVITADDIVDFKLYQNFTENSPTVGTCASNYIVFRARNQSTAPAENETVEVVFDLFYGDDWFSESLGVFYATSAETRNGVMKVTAYDAIAVKLGGKYPVTSNPPRTTLELLRAICTEKGISLAESTVTDIRLGNLLSGSTYRKQVEYCASLMGKNAVFDPTDNELSFRYFDPSDIEITADNLYDDSKFGEHTRSISEVKASNGNDSFSFGNQTGITVSYYNPHATSANTFSVYQAIKGTTCEEATVHFTGDPHILPGSAITVVDGGGISHTINAMQIVSEYDGGFSQKIYSYATTKAQSEADKSITGGSTIHARSGEIKFSGYSDALRNTSAAMDFTGFTTTQRRIDRGLLSESRVYVNGWNVSAETTIYSDTTPTTPVAGGRVVMQAGVVVGFDIGGNLRYILDENGLMFYKADGTEGNFYPAASQQTYWRVNGGFNVRSGPGTSYPRIGGAVAGDEYPYIGVGTDGWVNIRYSDSYPSAWIDGSSGSIVYH